VGEKTSFCELGEEKKYRNAGRIHNGEKKKLTLRTQARRKQKGKKNSKRQRKRGPLNQTTRQYAGLRGPKKKVEEESGVTTPKETLHPRKREKRRQIQ